MWAGALSAASIIAGLIMAYLLLAHPQAVTAIAGTAGSFVVTESRILQGR